MSQLLLGRQIDAPRRIDAGVVLELQTIVPQYYPNYPYHNYEGHIIDVFQRITAAHAVLQAMNVEVDLYKAQAAVLLHDIFYHEDHKSMGYESKEKLSAVRADFILDALGVVKEDIEEVHSAILATESSAEPQTNLEKLVRLMDIGNVGDEEPVFFRNTIAYATELAKRKVELDADWSVERMKFSGYLRLYVEPPIYFETKNGILVLLPGYAKFGENIALLEKSSFQEIMKIAGVEVVSGLPKSWTN